ncbi:hypothetical protein D4M24_12140 [Escherichia coli]|nr:hypothetical protein D4M24_12140 [Escherichia coli]
MTRLIPQPPKRIECESACNAPADAGLSPVAVCGCTTDGAAVNILAVAADQTSTTPAVLQSRRSLARGVLGPEAANERKNGRILPEQ